MIGVPAAVNEDGDIVFNVKAGAAIPLKFEDADGNPRDMTGSTVKFYADNGYSVQLAETVDTDTLLLSLSGTAFTGLVNKVGNFVVVDEGVNPFQEVWSGKIVITGWSTT